MLKELEGLWSQLGNPKFLAHLLEPVLLWGVALGLVGWIVSLWILKERKAQVCSLILLAVSALTVLPFLHFRRKASPMAAPSNALLNKQMERRTETQWVYWSMGGLALAGIFLTGPGKGKTGVFVAGLLIAGGISVVVFSLWLHEKEVAIFHPDARRSVMK